MMHACETLMKRHQMLPDGALVLVALSGGMDSMCLLDYLLSRGTSIAAAHFNHHLRGAESDGDEQFVRAYCEKKNIPLYVGGADVEREAKRCGCGIEETARRLRYAFLEQTAQEVGASKIATAHHADDCAETMLFHLARGTGADGMGIPAARGCYIRPLLTTTRQEIADYVMTRAIPFREDRSNLDTAYSRNHIRHRVMPLLREVNPRASEHMAHTAQRLQKESAFLDELAQRELRLLSRADGTVSLPCASFQTANEVLRGRMVRGMIALLPVGKKDFSSVHIDAVVALSEGRGTAQISLPHGVTARREGGTLSLFVSESELPQEALLDLEHAVVWGKYTISLQKDSEIRTFDEDTFCHLCGTMMLPLRCRAWRASERVILAGTDRPRTLKRLFADAGIDISERDRLPIIESDGAVAAVVPLGATAEFAAKSGYSLIIQNT